MQSTAHLTLQLIEVALASTDIVGQDGLQQRLLEQLSKLETTRHLQIVVARSEDTKFKIPPQIITPATSDAPAWFVQLVKPQPIEFRRILSGPDIPYTEILLWADPSDEITEVWIETRSVLIFLLLFIVLVNFLIYYTLGRDLAPIESILIGLERIELGDYNLRLPKFKLAELSRISDKFNHMAEVLLQTRQENRNLTQRSLLIQERERRNLARELHDELGQSLSAIKAVAVSIEKTTSDNEKSIKDSAITIMSFTDRMFEVAKNMMQRLRPSILDELGLLTALQEIIDSWNGRYGEVFCHFEHDSGISDLGEDININLYRIVQESLTNIAKHARANEVFVTMARTRNEKNEDILEVRIQDDGIGFDMTKVRKGLGLLGIRERVEALNGNFVLAAIPGEGVEMNITIPLNYNHQVSS